MDPANVFNKLAAFCFSPLPPVVNNRKEREATSALVDLCLRNGRILLGHYDAISRHVEDDDQVVAWWEGQVTPASEIWAAFQDEDFENLETDASVVEKMRGAGPGSTNMTCLQAIRVGVLACPVCDGVEIPRQAVAADENTYRAFFGIVATSAGQECHQCVVKTPQVKSACAKKSAAEIKKGLVAELINALKRRFFRSKS